MSANVVGRSAAGARCEGDRVARIHFINHASYVFEYGGVRLMCDPWLDGAVFDSGWDLLAETRLSYEIFEGLTHLWFSHEHPDHFNPPTLKKVPRNLRSRITVLYQFTIDKKVVEYCRRLGFREVVEMRPDEWMDLGDGVEVHCEPHDNGDSWLALRSPTVRMLNLNDCVVNSARECRRIRQRVGPVDVLSTQFSYANRVANPGDHRAMRAAAREKLSWVRTQVLTLEPRYLIPFASFSYFSHVDNWYLNDGINRIDKVVEFVRAETKTEPIVLYPDDCWSVNGEEALDGGAALLRYAADYKRIYAEGPRHESSRVPFEKLVEHGNEFVARLHARNSRVACALLPSLRIFVEDHGRALLLSAGGICSVPGVAADCDLVCKSDALDYCFLWEWGGRTLDINGRFRVPAGGQYWKFRALMTLASFNNRGEGLRETMQTVQRRLLKRLAPSA